MMPLTTTTNSIKHIEDINIGGLYYFPDCNMSMYDIDDPTDTCDYISSGDYLPSDVTFVPLELHTIKRKQFFSPFQETVQYRIKILTGTGNVGWLSLQDKDLEYIMPVTSCDKEL